MIPERFFAKTKERYENRATVRQEILRRKEAGATPLTLDTPERVEKYLKRRGLTEVAEAVPSLTDTAGSPAAETPRLPQTECLRKAGEDDAFRVVLLATELAYRR